MTGPWNAGGEAERIRLRELKDIGLQITRMLSSLKDHDEIVAVTSAVLQYMPEHLSMPAMEIVLKEKAGKVKRKRKR
jgi:hypothetical protein